MTTELYHHGVKGQHWGKRNGPPYPLYRKSAYYKKTGQRPPGYTGNKSGKERSSGGGKIGGLSDIKRAGGLKASISTTRNALKRNKKGKIGGIDIQTKSGTRIKIGDSTLSKSERKERSEKRKKIAKGLAIGAGVAAAGAIAYANRGKIANSFGKTKLGRIMNSRKLYKNAENIAKSEATQYRANARANFKFNNERGYTPEVLREMAKQYENRASQAAMRKSKYDKLLKTYVKNAAPKAALAGVGVTGAAIGANALAKKLKARKSGKIGNIPIQFKKTTPAKEIITDSKKLSDSAFKNKYKISKEQYSRALSEAKRTGKTVEIGIKGLNDPSDDERRAKIRKRILIGAGIAAGVAGGALVGRKLYQRKAALGMAGREAAAKDLRSAYARNEAAKKEASNIANNLKSQRDKLVVDRFNTQTVRGNLSGKRGIRAFLKRRKLAKKISNFDSKIAANEAAKAKNAWAAGETEMKYQYAKRGLLEARKTDAALKKIGNRQALASTLGLGVAGGAAGYGTSKLLRSKNQNGRIGGLSDIKRAGNTSWVRKRLRKRRRRR